MAGLAQRPRDALDIVEPIQALVFLPWAVPAFLSGLDWAWLFNPVVGPLPHWLFAAGVLATQQDKIAGHSVPSQVSQQLGLGRLALGVRVAFLALFAGVLAATLWRTWRGARWLDSYGWTTLALLAGTAWLLPWYGLWALLPASLSSSRRLRIATVVACGYLVAMRLAIKHPLAA